MAALAVAIVSFNTVAYANGAYVHKKLVYDNTLLHAHKIWADVSSLEGYVDEDVQVVFIGEFSKSKAAYTGPTGDKYEDVLLGSNGSSMTYDSSIEQYYYAILGRDMNVEVNDPELMENETVKAMSTYPSEGYCKWVGDKVVVKLSDSID